MWINSPLEQFEIRGALSIFSTFSIYTMLVLAVYYFLHIYVFKSTKLISNNYMIIIESLYSTILNMVKNQIGKQIYFPFIYSLFIFILLSNWISMIPYNFAINAQLIFTISLSITLWISLTILGLIKHKWMYFNLFVPSGTSLPLVPFLVLIELISNIARSISLGLRLGANILSGHLLLTILCGLIFDYIVSATFILSLLSIIPLIIILGIISLEFAIAAIQAYVFCVLTCSYIKDVLNLH